MRCTCVKSAVAQDELLGVALAATDETMEDTADMMADMSVEGGYEGRGTIRMQALFELYPRLICGLSPRKEVCTRGVSHKCKHNIRSHEQRRSTLTFQQVPASSASPHVFGSSGPGMRL